MVVAFAGTTPPPGWFLCDGSAISRTTYAALFNAIGTSHGRGDGSTTFNLPDYRGRFLRGVDHGVGRDPSASSRTTSFDGGSTGDAVGTLEPEGTRAPATAFTTTTDGVHSHTYNVYGGSFSTGSGAASLYTGFPLVEVRATSAAGAHSHSVIGGDPETRPPNISVDWIIKY